MQDMHITPITRALDVAGVKVPKVLADADKLVQAAQAHEQAVRATPAPDLGTLTVANVSALADALVDHGRQPERIDAARSIVGHAQHLQSIAWDAAADQLLELLRPGFTDTAARFTDAHRALGGNVAPEFAIKAHLSDAYRQLTDAGDELAVYAAARDALAAVMHTGQTHDKLDRWTRCAEVADWDTISRRIPVRVGITAYGSAAWFAALLNLDGTRLVWHSREQQIAFMDALPAHRDPANVFPDAPAIA